MHLCTETITVFNAVLDQSTGFDRYVGTVISGVSWFRKTLVNVTDGGIVAGSQITIRIPEDADFSGRTYADPIAYLSDPDSHFTLKPGDIIVKGAVEGDEWKPNTLQAAFADFCTIRGVNNSMRSGVKSPHWRVVGTA